MPEITADVPLLLRVAVGLMGGLLVVAGARWYYLGLYLAAFATGAALCASLLVALSPYVALLADPMVVGTGALLSGVVLAWAAKVAHRMAMLGAGAFTGFVVGVGGIEALAAPTWFPLLTLAVGALVFPWVYDKLLKVLTPAVGGACVAWAVGYPDQPALLGGLWVFGAVVQLVGDHAEAETDDDDEDEE